MSYSAGAYGYPGGASYSSTYPGMPPAAAGYPQYPQQPGAAAPSYPPVAGAYGQPPAGYPAQGYPPAGYGYPPGGYAAPGYGGYPGAAYPGYPPPGGYPPGQQPPQASQTSGAATERRGSASEKGSPGAKQEQSKDLEPAPVEQLMVSGCQDATVAEIVCGQFTRQGENHAKPFYKRDKKANDLDVMLYYWDDRDGDKFCGWWFGPKVGGDQVWAYHPERSTMLPPQSCWQVPYDGPADSKFDISPLVPVAVPDKVAGAEDRNGDDDSSAAEERRKKQAEENRRKLEEAEKRRIAEVQKKEEEKRRQEEERAKEQRRREEETNRRLAEAERRKEDEAKRKKDAEERRKHEQKATLTIRRVIQKVRAATPETFVELQTELQTLLDQELPTHSNAQKLRDEAEKGLDQAKKRIEQINEQHRRNKEKHLEEERKRLKAIDLSRARVKELEGLVAAAEKVAESLNSVANSLEKNDELSVEDVADLNSFIEKGASDVNAKVTACTEFILTKGGEMQDIASPTGETGTEIGEATQKLLERVNKCTRQSDEYIAAARSFKDRAATRANARARFNAFETAFKKYDKDGDGMLSRKEVIAFAKGEYNFNLASETLDTIFKNNVNAGERGVRFEKLLYMRITIGIARQVKIDRAMQTKRRQFEKEVAILKRDLQEQKNTVVASVDKVDEDLKKIEKLVLSFKEKRVAPSAEMFALADETQAAIEDAKVAWSEAHRQMERIGEGIEPRIQEVFKDFSYHELRPHEMRIGRMEARIARTEVLSSRYRDRAQQMAEKQTAELTSAAAAMETDGGDSTKDVSMEPTEESTLVLAAPRPKRKI